MRGRNWFVTLAVVTLMVPLYQLKAQLPRDTACVPTSRQLNRIAAAVDGYMRGERVWVVVECGDTGRVVGTATSEPGAAAIAAATRVRTWTSSEWQGKLYEVAVMLGFADGYTTGCRHETDTSNMLPSGICGARVIPVQSVASITLHYRLRNGQTIEQPVPLNTDVLFLQYSGIEKFAYPYYERIEGLDGVTKMRDDMFDRRRAALRQER